MAWWAPITVIESIALDFILRVAGRKLVYPIPKSG